jgi:hypothetical protein
MNPIDNLIAIYHYNEVTIKMNPCDFEAYIENEAIYQSMVKYIPQSHLDNINLLVYGISRA